MMLETREHSGVPSLMAVLSLIVFLTVVVLLVQQYVSDCQCKNIRWYDPGAETLLASGEVWGGTGVTVGDFAHGRVLPGVLVDVL